MQPDEIEQVRQYFVTNQIEPTIDLVTDVVREIFPMSSQYELVKLVDQAVSLLFGIGPLEHLLLRPGVTDILVNRFDDVWVNEGTGLVKTNVSFGSEKAVRDFAINLAIRGNRRLDELHPYVDMQLSSGLRFHAVLPPLAIAGTAISIRVPAATNLTLSDLQAMGFMNSTMHSILTQIIDSQKSFLISGGTGSGKTTLLAAMLSMVDPTHRILVIEDAAELNVVHPHLVKVQSRLANSEGLGQVTMTDLVRQALRMRPDRIVVGEVRESEALDLLIALNSGLPGMGTLHANSARDAIAKLQILPLLAGENISHRFIAPTIASSIDLIVHVTLDRYGVRRVSEIAAVTGRVENLNPEVDSLYTWHSESGSYVRGLGSVPHPEKFAALENEMAHR